MKINIIFSIISRSVLLIMRNVSDKRCRELANHILFSIHFSPQNHAVYETMWKNIVERGRPQMTV